MFSHVLKSHHTDKPLQAYYRKRRGAELDEMGVKANTGPSHSGSQERHSTPPETQPSEYRMR